MPCKHTGSPSLASGELGTWQNISVSAVNRTWRMGAGSGSEIPQHTTETHTVILTGTHPIMWTRKHKGDVYQTRQVPSPKSSG